MWDGMGRGTGTCAECDECAWARGTGTCAECDECAWARGKQVRVLNVMSVHGHVVYRYVC